MPLNDANLIPALAQELVGLQPDIILTGATPATVALQRETRTIPIVFASAGDPVAIALGREPRSGLVVVPDGSIAAHQAPIISAAARNNVPAVFWPSAFAREGGLLSYGPDQVDNWRRAASYVDRILRGDKPGDLPVQFPTKFEMVVNLKTAKALGLTVPLSILVRADEVIE
jgi:putative ABC transport system substrate-binding protein